MMDFLLLLMNDLITEFFDNQFQFNNFSTHYYDLFLSL